MKAYGLLQMMLPGPSIKCTVFEAAGRPHFVHEIYRGFFTKPPPVLLERIRRALGDSAGFPRRFGTGTTPIAGGGSSGLPQHIEGLGLLGLHGTYALEPIRRPESSAA